MVSAFKDATKVLLKSADKMGHRLEQHSSVTKASKINNVKTLAYTSVLHAYISPLKLAEEHKQTEGAIVESGVPYVMLRNGWYTENNLVGRDGVIINGVLYCASGNRRWSSASRLDYAEAAAAILLSNEDLSGDFIRC